MPGGLLNIVAYGNQNIILNGNPSKTFFKSVYAKYTNFGIQKFRIDFEGSRQLNEETDSVFTFKIPRNADLLLDSYLVVTLPNIFSPILPPLNQGDLWKPYHFKWIRNIGTSMIRSVKIMIGTQIIQEFPGEYIRCVVERDFPESKKQLFYRMTGNIDELHSPENYGENRNNNYPNVFYTPDVAGSEPSIRGRKLYIPLNPWFMNDSKTALPLVCLQYSEVKIEVTLRSIRDMFTINDITSIDNDVTRKDGFNTVEVTDGQETEVYVYSVDYELNIEKLYTRRRANFGNEAEQMYNFLQQPPTIELSRNHYTNKINNWNADIHLITNMCFLTTEESNVFALNEQKMLIKDVKYNVFYNIAGPARVKLDTNALVSSWMWFYRRNDIYERNEWSNYTNWKTSKIPYELDIGDERTPYVPADFPNLDQIGPGVDYDLVTNLPSITTNHRVTPLFSNENQKKILQTFSIIFDGKNREDEMDAGVFEYIEKYRSSKGSSDVGIYNYNFCIQTSPHILQPSGAINLSRFKTIELDMVTIQPPVNPESRVTTICDDDGNIIGVSQDEQLYNYTFELHLFEERYNILRFISGNAGLLFAR